MHVQLAKFPNDPRCRFTNIQKQLPAPFVVYADFEYVLKRFSDMDTTHGVEEVGKPSIVPYQEHIACSFAYKIVSIGNPGKALLVGCSYFMAMTSSNISKSSDFNENGYVY